MSISKMIIYSSSLVAIIAAAAGVIAYGSFSGLEASINNSQDWRTHLNQLQSTILITCFSIFFIALFCGQFIARFLNKTIANLAMLANGGEKIDGNQSANKKSFSSLENALIQSRTISRQKKQLENLNEELRLKNDSLDSLVYRVSHDLKAPIINIQSLLVIIRSRLNATTDPLLKQSLSMADKATMKLQTTIVDFLEVARIEKRLQSEKEWLSIFDIISGILEDNQQQINEKATMFDIELSEANELYFSRNNLSSILANLITNAIKFASPNRDSMVKIYTKKQKASIVIVIADNGIGMDLEKHKENLFQMFKRFHNHVEGTGIGMYIVKKLMDENGGTVHLESEVNVGTKLTLTFQQPANDLLTKEEVILSDQL